MELFYAVIILFICSSLQTIAGFAFSLFAVPLLLVFSFDLSGAVVLSMSGSMIQRLLVIAKFREHIEWKPFLLSCCKKRPFMTFAGFAVEYAADNKQARLKNDLIRYKSRKDSKLIRTRQSTGFSSTDRENQTQKKLYYGNFKTAEFF